MENPKNNENKQSTIESIKKLAEIYSGNIANDLLRELKKTRQQLEPLIRSVKDKIAEIKETKKEIAPVEQPQVQKVVESPIVEIQKVEEKPVEKVVEEKKVEIKVEKPFENKDSKPYKTEDSQFDRNNNGARPPYDPNRPRQPYDPNRPRPQFDRNNNGQRPPYDPNRPRQPYDPNRPRAPYDPNRPRQPYDPNRPRPPYDPNRPRQPYDPNRPRPPYDPNRPRSQFDRNNNGDRNAQQGLLGITRIKKTDLTSANVFINKERDYGANKKKKTTEGGGLKDGGKYNKKQLIRKGIVEEQDIEERMVSRKLKLKKTKQEVVANYAPVTHAVITTPNLTVKILSEKISKPATEIIKQFMLLGIMTTINSVIDFATAELVANELGIELELNLEKTAEEQLKENAKETKDENLLKKRPPIVTVMGHVDHGKTSLLDRIRKTHVTAGEAGGITQHIGAYSITTANKEKITFIDTPGHQAFTAMRARGAKLTDIAILVVAADDGIMPQTVEAINHIKAAKVPIIVAVNKIDKQGANIDRIKQQLTEHEILPEEWGGDAIIVPVSALTGEGIDKLLEMILLVADVQNLRANPQRSAVGAIVEAKLDKGKGPVANIIVQDGTLKTGDTIVTGFVFGRVRTMYDDNGKVINSAGPSTPVSVLGLDTVPNAGDVFQAVDGKLSKNVIEERKNKLAQEMAEMGARKSLDDFLNTKAGEDKKVLNIIIKADVQGSVEALKQSLKGIENEEACVDIIHTGVGAITENDVQLASVSNALLIGFNTKPDSKAAVIAERNKINIKLYKIIYEAIEEVERLIKGMKEPKYQEKVIGHAEVRVLFKISSVGTIAGCRVLDGKIQRGGFAKVLRKDATIFEGRIASLKNQKDDAKEMAAGFECGIKLDDFNNFIEGDIIECSIKERIED